MSRTGSTQRLDILATGNQELGVEDGAEYVVYNLANNDRPQSTLFVLDAKYYDIIGAISHGEPVDGKSISYLPGLEDIRKQYAYADWIQREKKGFSNIINGLLFPTFSLESYLNLSGPAKNFPFELLGNVQIGKKEPIQVLGINIDLLMTDYVTQSHIH